jgi:hypothetical protein
VRTNLARWMEVEGRRVTRRFPLGLDMIEPRGILLVFASVKLAKIAEAAGCRKAWSRTPAEEGRLGLEVAGVGTGRSCRAGSRSACTGRSVLQGSRSPAGSDQAAAGAGLCCR